MVKRIVSLYLTDDTIRELRERGVNISARVNEFLSTLVVDRREISSLQQVLNLETGAFVDAPEVAEKKKIAEVAQAKDRQEQISEIARSARDLWPPDWRRTSAPAHEYLVKNAEELGMPTDALERAINKELKKHPGSGRKKPGAQGKKARVRTVHGPKITHVVDRGMG